MLSAQAKTLFEQAASHWQEYQRRGGINGLMRLEQTVSPSFRQQTQRLAQAYEAASGGARRHDLLRQAILKRHASCTKTSWPKPDASGNLSPTSGW